MGLSILEITEIPQHSLLEVELKDAKRDVNSAIRNLLSYVSSVSRVEEAVTEIIFYKGESRNLRMFLTVRYENGAISVSSEQFVHTIMAFLQECHYGVHELTDDAFIEVVSSLRTQLSGNIVALTKSEKCISSSISYSGYYYFTDIFDNCGKEIKDADNFNMLLSYLKSCKNAMVAFQLIPTQLSQEEYYALSSLGGELSATTQGIFIEHQLIREPAAETPKKVYNYYIERASQPLFISNIIVSAETGSIDGLISVIKTGIQASLNDPIGMTAIPIDNDNTLSYDFFHFPWNLYSRLLMNYRNAEIWNDTAYQPINLTRLPFLFSLYETVSFFRLPLGDDKVQGIRSNRMVNDNEVIDECVMRKDNIIFGTLINNENSSIGVNNADFTRHALIVGTPGSGKTTFALNLLLQFYRKSVPFLAIEPTKTEYRALIDLIPDLQVFTPGKSNVSPFIINPFLPPKGIALEQYIPSLISAFRAAFSMESPLDVIFLRAIRQTYAKYGWKDHSCSGDSDVQKFGMFEFIVEFKKVVASSAYKAETKANIETGGTFRLMNLLDQNRNIYDTIQSIPIEALLEKPTILELNAIADDEQKSLLMALLLISICLHTMHKGSSSGEISNVLMIDEAHVLLDTQSKTTVGQNKAQSTTVKSLQKMIAEIRSFGMGVIIADQKPSKVTLDVVADTDIKVAFRLVEANERSIIANSMNMTEQQSQYLARLKKGEAITYFSDLESMKVIITPDVRAQKGIRYAVPDIEIQERTDFWDKHKELLVPFYECSACEMCRKKKCCNSAAKRKAEYYSSHIVSLFGSRIHELETLTKYLYRLDELIVRYETSASREVPIKLVCNCTKVHFIRKMIMESNIPMSREVMNDLLAKTLIGGKENV